MISRTKLPEANQRKKIIINRICIYSVVLMLLLLLRANRMYLSAFCSLTIQTISFSLSIAYLSTYLRYIFLKSFPDIIYRAKYIKFSFFFLVSNSFSPLSVDWLSLSDPIAGYASTKNCIRNKYVYVYIVHV